MAKRDEGRGAGDPPGGAGAKQKRAVERAAGVDWRGWRARHSLRRALTVLLEELERWCYCEMGVALPEVSWGSREMAGRLMDLLLELEVVDLIGLAQLLRDRTSAQVVRQRKRSRRKFPHELPPVSPAPPPVDAEGQGEKG